ncbi:MAG: formate dehydrogenase, partial [Stellaceae bacterium]
MSATKIYIPRDSGALALGADDVEEALLVAAATRKIEIEIAHTGSRGMYWLEPMIEVATPSGRIAYGPVA